MLTGLTRRILAQPLEEQRHRLDRLMVGQARTHAIANRAQQRIPDLSAVEFPGFSQWGEDGIIDWLVDKLPGIPESFVEFGVGDYREANTRMLLELRNWRGLVLDCGAEEIAAIRGDTTYWRHDLNAIQAFIRRDNINDLIGGQDIRGDIGLLSVDIDGNDYWVWQALDSVRPWIVVCEYQAVLGDVHALSVPYRPDFDRRKAHHSWLYFGASLRAMEELGRAKGYTAVGSCSHGLNLFLVRDDKVGDILGRIDRVMLHGSRFRESRGVDGRLSFLRGAERSREVGQLDYVNVRDGSIVRLDDLADLYSPAWLQRYGD